MDKTYLLIQYHCAVLDFMAAKNEDEQWKARKEMARIEQTAGELFGFEFVDELRKREHIE